ncbi:MAG: hypothetical protein E7359_02835, partial [Clostridiales bacterium]|nr:hypothetical protein [Clostridiales bacterium]
MRKIVNPFKKFLNNIVLGLILLLTVFCAVPVAQNLFNKEVHADKTIYITPVGYAYEGYINNKLEIRSLSTGGKGSKRKPYFYYYMEDDITMYFGNTDNIARPNKTYTLSGSRQGGFQKTKKGEYIVGYFTNSSCTIDSLINFGSTLYDSNKITNNSTVYCLVANNRHKVTVKATPQLSIGSYTWQSTYGGDFTVNSANSVDL